ncbi:type 2 lanthipeptide synthetase LanM family protein [Micromonospora taraxaci]|uniref:type 2 lanthipeptide synthetase LanM family protein n=1 Tax=Micromonospora taraxaci TaxID=1316803 RepID=UPI0033D093D9
MPFGPSGPNGTHAEQTGTGAADQSGPRQQTVVAGVTGARPSALSKADGPEPDWAFDVTEAYGTAPLPTDVGRGGVGAWTAGGPTAGADGRGEQAGNGDELPFLPLTEPLAELLRKRLSGSLTEIRCDRLPSPDRLADLLLPGLLPRLNAMVQRTCLLELAACREAGLLAGQTPQERFADFRKRLSDPVERHRLMVRYPVLARQLAVTGRAWIGHAIELVTRLAQDLADLVRTFSPDRDPGTVVDILTGLGDPHRGARSVAMVCFSGGLRIVYKPRPMAVDGHFQDLVAWVNERSPGPRLRILRCLDRGTYGWMEHVDCSLPCDEQAERRYHRRQGGLLAILYLLHAGDFHSENLIAAGDQPVLVDLESLFQPELPSLRPVGESNVERLAAGLLSGSVMHAGLLPMRPSPWGTGEAGMAEVGTPRPHRAEVRLPSLAGAGTDQMRFELTFRAEAVPEAGPAERPVGKVAPQDQVDQIVQGFTEVYRTIEGHRDELGAVDGPLEAFAADEVRVLARDTMTYAVLLGASFHPSLLLDGLDRDKHFDRLLREADHRPGLRAIVEAERRDLWQGDIPIFSTGVAQSPVRDSSGQPLPDVPAVAGLGIARTVLAGLGPADLARQTWLIRACIAVNGIRRDQPYLFHRHPTQPAELPAPDHRIADAVAGIADQLAQLAVQDDDDAAWIGAQFGFRRFCSVEVLGPGLHDGLLGIALFLAWHAEIAGDRCAHRLARSAVRTAVRQIRRGLLGRVAGLSGLGGAVYGLSQLGALWEDDTLFREADRLIEELPTLLAADREFEVMEGTAGALFGLVARHHVRPSGRSRELVRTAADRLVSTQRAYGPGASWLPAEVVANGLADRPLAGFGHGTAGIAAALLAGADLLSDESYAVAAARGFEYERDLFDPRNGYWTDIRDHSRAGEVRMRFDDGSVRSSRSVAWCHGSPGIGMARLAAMSRPGPAGCRPELSEELSSAVDDTLQSGFGNGHSLCHGDLGSLDFLQLVGDQTGDPALLHRVRRQAAAMLDSVATTGWHCGLHRDVGIPGLLTGLAGIGYGLLRLLAPRRVPSLLAQQSLMSR